MMKEMKLRKKKYFPLNDPEISIPNIKKYRK